MANPQRRDDDGVVNNGISRHGQDESLAPTYHVPDVDMISIEHPCIVRNLDNGFKSLGGEQQIKHLFEHRSEQEAGAAAAPTASTPAATKEENPPNVGVSLRPNDPFAKKIYSNPVPTENMLLKVTLPKRTGRKRKRGTEVPFVLSNLPTSAAHDISAKDLLRRLADNPNKYTIKPVGSINETHRFRNLPDLQMRADEVPIMREIRDHGMSPNYENLKKFTVSNQPGSAGIEAFPAPPLFFNPGQSLQHGYQQHREPAKAKKRSLRFPVDPSTPVPTEPPSTLPKAPALLEKILPRLRQLLSQRPILTVEIVKYEMPRSPKKQIEAALLYVAYYADCGAWKGCWIRYGVDPREDPQYRIYQTLHFISRKNAAAPSQQQKQRTQTAEPEVLEPLQPAPPNDPENSTQAAQERPPEPQPKIPIKKPPNGIAPRRKTRKRNVLECPYFDGFNAAQFITHYQLCDITTTPLLGELVNDANVRGSCDSLGWGWYWSGTLAGVRVLMKEMLAAVAAAGGSVPHGGDGHESGGGGGGAGSDSQTPPHPSSKIITPEMTLIASFFSNQDSDIKEDRMFIPLTKPSPEGLRWGDVDKLMDEARRLYRFAIRNQKRDMSSRSLHWPKDGTSRVGGGKGGDDGNDDEEDNPAQEADRNQNDDDDGDGDGDDPDEGDDGDVEEEEDD